MTLTDSQLISAYLDGELNDIDRANFEKRLQQEQSLADQLVEYEHNDLMLKQQYSEIDDTPVPEAILSMLQQEQDQPQEQTTVTSIEEPDSQTPSKNNNVVEISSWRAKKWLPMAASFLVVALAVPLYMQTNQQSPDNLASVLSQTTSGSTVQLEDDQQIHLNMSFNNGQGDLCREYMLIKSQTATHNVACMIDGRWQTQISDAINVPDSQQYQPASGELSPKVEAWLDQNMYSDPLSKAQEKKHLTTLK